MIIWLNPTSGISGDMLLGALLDLGAPIEQIRAAVDSTGLRGWSLDATTVQRAGLRAVHAVVTVHDDAVSRTAAELLDMVGRSPDGIRQVAVAAVTALAECEAVLHGTTVDEVHLHEVGGHDTVVDIVGVAAGLAALGVTEIHCAPVRLGSGTVKAAHGELPVPAPATLALLAGVPVVGVPGAGETVTPTGAALLRALEPTYGEVPAMTLDATGYGAGRRDTPSRPNVLPVLAGRAPGGPAGSVMETVLVLETTIDDVTGEVIGVVTDRLRASGALDAWTTPVIGKKGRPAHVISALVGPGAVDDVEQTLARETGTLGIRRHRVERRTLPRHVDRVEVDGDDIRIKVGPYGAKPEHDDVLRASLASGKPYRDVAAAAMTQWRRDAAPGAMHAKSLDPTPTSGRSTAAE